MKKFIITEAEKSRILGMHHNAIKQEFISEQIARAGEPEDLVINQPTTTPTGTPKQETVTFQTQGDKNYVPTQILQAQDKDYYYKKEGDKYYFKLVEEPVSTKAKEFAKQGKFKDWTEAKNPKAIEGISKLKFTKVEKMELKPLSGVSLSSKVITTGTTVGGGAKPLAQLAGTPTPDLLKQFPNLATLDQATQTKITTWTKSPAGQYILNTPADQREKAMDNLDKMFGGDPLTKELKKPIRQALGMKADNIFGRIGSAVKGGVAGAKQGFQQQS
jgi:hypothetical protein